MSGKSETRAVIRAALASYTGAGTGLDMSSDDLDALASHATDALEALENSCTCGWGGQHDPDNPKCERNIALPPAPDAASLPEDYDDESRKLTQQQGESGFAFTLRQLDHAAWNEGHDAACPFEMSPCWYHRNPHGDEDYQP